MDSDEQYFAEILNHVVLNNDMSIFEFGVATGNCLVAILNVLISRNQIPKQVIGFDSFLGLPKEEDGVVTQAEWVEGAYNLLQENLDNNKITNKAKTWQEAYFELKKRFKLYEKYNIFVKLIKGFYSESLTKEIVQSYNIKPAMFIHFDCDMYISTKQALGFCIKNNLLAPDCLIEYNDWGGTPDGAGGESKAHYEMEQKYGLIFETIKKGPISTFKYKGHNYDENTINGTM